MCTFEDPSPDNVCLHIATIDFKQSIVCHGLAEAVVFLLFCISFVLLVCTHYSVSFVVMAWVWNASGFLVYLQGSFKLPCYLWLVMDRVAWSVSHWSNQTENWQLCWICWCFGWNNSVSRHSLHHHSTVHCVGPSRNQKI